MTSPRDEVLADVRAAQQNLLKHAHAWDAARTYKAARALLSGEPTDVRAQSVQVCALLLHVLETLKVRDVRGR